MSLSLCMIVKNETDYLARCLASVQGLVDQIVVVDTGSTDDSVDIARSFGAEIHHFEWIDDFAAARNESLRHATGDWILILDADECLNPEEHHHVREAMAKEHEAFCLPLRNYFRYGNSATFDQGSVLNNTGFMPEHRYYSDSLGLRLFRAGHHYTGKIHELPDIDHFERCGAVIHHRGKMNDARELGKREVYLRMCLEAVEAEPDSAQAHFNLAGEAYSAENWELALRGAQGFMRLKPEETPLIMIVIAGAALQAQGLHPRALDHFRVVIESDPKHVYARVLAARSLFALGEFDLATSVTEQAIEINPNFTAGYLNLMKIRENLGDLRGAWLAVLRALEKNPHDDQLMAQFDRLTAMGR